MSVREDASVVYYAYDDADRLAGFTWKDSGGSTLYAFAWDYDAVGNRVHEARNGVHTYYEYDAGNELIRYREMPADEWRYFAYDPHGRGNCSLIHRPAAGEATYFAYNDADLAIEIRSPRQEGTPRSARKPRRQCLRTHDRFSAISP